MLSVADTSKVTISPFEFVVSIVISEGVATLGGIVSWTVTVKDAFTPVVAVHKTTVSPIGKIEPD